MDTTFLFARSWRHERHPHHHPAGVRADRRRLPVRAHRHPGARDRPRHLRFRLHARDPGAAVPYGGDRQIRRSLSACRLDELFRRRRAHLGRRGSSDDIDTRPPDRDGPSIAMSSVFGNTAMLGLPLAIATFGAVAAAPAALVLSIHAPALWLDMVHSAAVSDKEHDGRSDGRDARHLARNPIVSPSSPARWRLTGFELPPDQPARRVARASGRAGLSGRARAHCWSAPRSRARAWLAHLRPETRADAAARLALAAHVFELPPLQLAVLVILAAMPTGGNAFLFAVKEGARSTRRRARSRSDGARRAYRCRGDLAAAAMSDRLRRPAPDPSAAAASSGRRTTTGGGLSARRNDALQIEHEALQRVLGGIELLRGRRLQAAHPFGAERDLASVFRRGRVGAGIGRRVPLAERRRSERNRISDAITPATEPPAREKPQLPQPIDRGKARRHEQNDDGGVLKEHCFVWRDHGLTCNAVRSQYTELIRAKGQYGQITSAMSTCTTLLPILP